MHSQTSPRRILLVDDDPDIRSLTKTFLHTEGYEVFSSGDADRAAAIFRSVGHIDLLVTDIYMPQRSGIELGLELRSLQPILPILLISGGAPDLTRYPGMDRRAWSFLAKPFRLPDLLAAVHVILASEDGTALRIA